MGYRGCLKLPISRENTTHKSLLFLFVFLIIKKRILLLGCVDMNGVHWPYEITPLVEEISPIYPDDLILCLKQGMRQTKKGNSYTAKLLFYQSPTRNGDYTVTGQGRCSHRC